MYIIVWIKPGECRPTAWFNSYVEAAKAMDIHIMTIRKQVGKDGFYSSKKGCLFKVKKG